MQTSNPQSDALLIGVEQASPTAHVHALSGVACAEGEALSPPLVIRGESLEENTYPEGGESFFLVTDGRRSFLEAHPQPKPDGVAYAAITDYLNTTFPFNSCDLTQLFMQLEVCLGQNFTPAVDRRRPLHFYENSYSLGASSGIFAFGKQGGMLSLSGEACHLVPDWKKLIALVRDTLSGRISRWDGAVDDYNGTHSVDMALQMYLGGEFNAGGNEPSCEQRGNWIKPDGKGRTLYVGKRENGKMARIYEKGMQLGALNHPWVRWEVELHNTDRIIPFEVLLEPGKYVAGAYPAFSWVHEEMQRIRTIQKTGKISYESSIGHAKNAYGKLINTMMAIEGSAEIVIEKLIRDGIPARLNTPSLTEFGK
jgi:phage replication initiation protein